MAVFTLEDMHIALVNITRWPSVLVFLLAGAAAMTLAFSTINLFSHSFASLRFLREHGWDAIEHGVLVQMGELLVWGFVALVSWLTFKICEQELEDRYFAWARRDHRTSGAESGSESADSETMPPG